MTIFKYVKNIIRIITILFLFWGCKGFFNDEVIIEAIRQFPKGFDPASNFSVDELQIYSQIYESLFIIDTVENSIKPNLAEYIQTTPNNDSYIIKLRPNVYFHDGKVLNSIDIKNSFDWQMKKYYKSTVFEMLDHVEILDSLRLKIVLKYSYSMFPYLLASPLGLVVMSSDAIKKYGDEIKFHPIGTGPYLLKDWREGDYVSLKPFKDYWNFKNQAKEVKFLYYPNKYKREESIDANESDILYLISGYSIDRLRWLGKINYKVLTANSTLFLGFNNSDSKLRDKRLRRAILKSINLPKLVLNVNRGNAVVAEGPTPPLYGNANLQKQENYDLNMAKNLIKEMGFDNKLTLNFYFPKVAYLRNTILEIIKSDLSKIGISLKIREFDNWEEHTKAVNSDSSQLFLYGGKSETLGDAESFLRSFFHSKSEFNTLHYQNARVDAWLDQARLESDPERRQELYKKITEQILEDTPAVFLYHVKPHFAYNREKIKTLPVNPYGIIQYHKIELNN